MASACERNLSSVDSTNSDTPIKEVELGFVERTESWKLQSKYFPSKIGGKPAWLSLKDLPSVSTLECSVCQKPCVFLLQVYAPINDISNAFHRTIFIFVCRNPKCHIDTSRNNFVVLRSQLPKQNEFYSSEPPVEIKDSISPSAETYQPLCVVCGCSGPKRCGRCRSRNYCSKDHQIWDWKNGHKLSCLEDNFSFSSGQICPYLMPEYDLVTEVEDYEETKDEKSTADKMSEYEAFLKSPEASNLIENNYIEKDLESMVNKYDKVFNDFQERVSHEPEQVLRYQRGSQPLWVSSECIPSTSDIPPCTCGAPRIFEFQVMPQLLNHLELDKVDDIDWGILAVYTCIKSCDIGVAYHREFLWKQTFSVDK